MPGSMLSMPLPPRPPLSSKDRAHQLRRALFWASQVNPHWAEAIADLAFHAVLPSFSPVRLQATTRTAGSCLVSIDAGILRLLRIEVTHSVSLSLPLPDHILSVSPGAVRGALLAAPTGSQPLVQSRAAAVPFLKGTLQ